MFSPANLAPILWPRNVMMLHDAAVLREPGAYTRAYRIWHQRLGVRCARRALRVLTVSEFSRRELLELAGLSADRVVVIRGGVDRRFRPERRSRTGPEQARAALPVRARRWPPRTAARTSRC